MWSEQARELLHFTPLTYNIPSSTEGLVTSSLHQYNANSTVFVPALERSKPQEPFSKGETKVCPQLDTIPLYLLLPQIPGQDEFTLQVPSPLS